MENFAIFRADYISRKRPKSAKINPLTVTDYNIKNEMFYLYFSDFALKVAPPVDFVCSENINGIDVVTLDYEVFLYWASFLFVRCF